MPFLGKVIIQKPLSGTHPLLSSGRQLLTLLKRNNYFTHRRCTQSMRIKVASIMILYKKVCSIYRTSVALKQ